MIEPPVFHMDKQGAPLFDKFNKSGVYTITLSRSKQPPITMVTKAFYSLTQYYEMCNRLLFIIDTIRIV